MANQHYANEFYDKAARAQVSSTIVSKKANVCPFTVRLAWHASGTFDSSQDEGALRGGSDGATMRFPPELTDDANAGLALMQDILQPVREKFPDLSIADLWTMAGTQAIALTGGPIIPFRYGRSDTEGPESCPPNGRLPDASQGAAHLRDVFYRMGFEDRDIVALSGAHTLGSCHRLRSGFDGPWTHNPLRFDNEYFKNLLELEWTIRDWDGPKQFQDPSGKLMMLPTDMALIEDEGFLPFVKAYAEDEQLFFRDFADAFSKLIAKGCPAHCQPDSPSSSADTPVEASVNKDFRDLAMHGSVERMQELLENSNKNGDVVNVNSTEALSGRTALHKAAFFGHGHVIEFLLEQDGILIDLIDADGDTALHDASRFGHVRVVEALLAKGVDKTLVNKDGKTALDLARAAGKDDLVAILS